MAIPDSSGDGKSYGFSARDSERISVAVKRIESKYQNELPQRRRSPVSPGIGLIRVELPTGIAAGSLAAPSSKTDCIILKRSGDGYTSDKTGQKIFNCDTTAVTGTNKAGWAVSREDGNLELVLADC